MSESLREQIVAALDQIKDPCSVATGLPMGLAEMGLIKAVRISEAGEVDIDLRLTAPFCHMINFFQEEWDQFLAFVKDIDEVKPDDEEFYRLEFDNVDIWMDQEDWTEFKNLTREFSK